MGGHWLTGPRRESSNIFSAFSSAGPRGAQRVFPGICNLHEGDRQIMSERKVCDTRAVPGRESAWCTAKCHSHIPARFGTGRCSEEYSTSLSGEAHTNRFHKGVMARAAQREENKQRRPEKSTRKWPTLNIPHVWLVLHIHV